MRLGIAGGVLACAMIIIGTVTAIVRAKGASPIPGVNPLSFLTIPLVDMLVFGILVGGAFYYRRKVDIHKRLMLLATIGILPAAVARLPFDFVQQYGPLALRHHQPRTSTSGDSAGGRPHCHLAPVTNNYWRDPRLDCIRHLADSVDLIFVAAKNYFLKCLTIVDPRASRSTNL